MVKKISDLYLEARKAFMATEDVQTASLMARSLLCHLTGKTQEEILAGRELYASEKTCVEMERAVLTGDISGAFPHLWWVLGYAIALFILAVLLFLRQMKKQ